MKFGTSMIIFLLAIVAIVAEFILYFIFGIGSIFSGGPSSLSGTAAFFGGLMIFTIAAGILAPACSFLGYLIEKFVDTEKMKKGKGIKQALFKDIGTSTYMILLGLVLIFSIFAISAGNDALQDSQNQEDYSTGSQSTSAASTPEAKQNDTKTGNPTNQRAVSESTSVDPTEKYLEKVELQNLNLTEGYGQFDMPGYDEKKPAVTGKIKNNGDKTLSEVELTIYFLDDEGNRIAETQFYPVLTSTYTGDDSPLKPNYVRDFGYILEDDAPSDWGDEIEAEISNIEFQEAE